MYSTILHKRSDTPGNVPGPNVLSAGEIAINTADGKVFTKAFDGTVKTFLNADQQPYTLNQTLSSVNFQYGNNTSTEILAAVLGGVDNDVSGAGSTVVNGSDNDIAADYAFVGNGSNNTILTGGDYGAILAGQNNTLNHQESFILGSNITSHLSGFTYVNNLSVVGKIYGDGSEISSITGGTDLDTVINYLSTNNIFLSSAQVGSQEQTTATLFARGYKVGVNTESPNQALTVVGSVSATGSYYGDGSQLTGIIAGDTEATTLVRSNSANWEGTYTTVQTNSATTWNYQGTDLKALSGNWQNTYTTVQSNSAQWQTAGSGLYLPLSGGNLTGNVTTTAVISSTNVVYASGERVIVGQSTDTTPVYKIRAMTQIEYNALGVYDDNTIYFIKQ